MTKCHANIYVKKPPNEKLFVQRWKDKENILIWTFSTRFCEPTNNSTNLGFRKRYVTSDHTISVTIYFTLMPKHCHTYTCSWTMGQLESFVGDMALSFVLVTEELGSNNLHHYNLELMPQIMYYCQDMYRNISQVYVLFL